MPHGKLAGVTVCLSAGLDDNDPRREAVGDFTARLARAVWREGGTLLHGSQPNIVPLLEEAAKPLGATARERLTLARAAQYSTPKYDEAIKRHERFARVERCPARRDPEREVVEEPVAADASETVTNEELVPLRDWMADRCDVVVALAGRWWDHDKDRSGIPKEIDTFLALGKPAFVITAFDGAARGYAEDDPGLLGRLRNGLDAAANREIDAELRHDGDKGNAGQIVAERVVKQISLLPLGRATVPASPRTDEAAHAAGETDPAVAPRDRFRILCLDGGGIRGAFTAAVLATWADMFCNETGQQRFASHFDLIAGTSTGSILAVGLAMGKTPAEILALYKDNAIGIFPDTLPGRMFVTTKYDPKPLQTALEKSLGDALLAAARQPLVIPAVIAQSGEAMAFTTPHHPDRSHHGRTRAVEAVMASAAAPIYFSAATVEGRIVTDRYLDGGVWANNPVLPAIAEAIRYRGADAQRIDVLSVGTMTTTNDFSKKLDGGAAQWGKEIVSLFFAAQETAAEELATMYLNKSHLYRVNPVVAELPALDAARDVVPLLKMGQRLAEKTFSEVRGRFLDGIAAPPWTKH